MVIVNNLNTNDNYFAHELNRLEQKQIKGGFFSSNSKGKSSKSKSDFLNKFTFDLDGKKMFGINSVETTGSGKKIIKNIIKSSGGKVIINGKEL